MLSSVTLDQARRRKVKTYEQHRRNLKALRVGLGLRDPMASRKAALSLAQRGNVGSAVSVVNRCTQSGRGRGVHGRYRRSRILVREYALRGLLPGVRKTSW